VLNWDKEHLGNGMGWSRREGGKDGGEGGGG
jgi:hypothetical protein